MIVSILFYYICIGLVTMAVQCFITAFFPQSGMALTYIDGKELKIVAYGIVLWPLVIITWVYYCLQYVLIPFWIKRKNK